MSASSTMSAGPEEIAIAIRRLREGGLVAFPTETVYGLGADALDEAAIAKVFALKGRPANNPLIVHVSGVAMAKRVVAAWPGEAEALAREFWPGPVSIVLPRAAVIPAAVTAGGLTVAVRCPDHPLTLALLEAFGNPLVGPSANPSGGVSPTTAEHVRESFGEDEVYVLDGGPCVAGIESTVISLAGDSPRVLRPGVVGAAELAAVLGKPVTGAGAAEGGIGAAATGASGSPRSLNSGPLPSPGMLETHYAPRTPAVMVGAADVARVLAAAPGPAVVVTHEPVVVAGPHRVEVLPAQARAYAAGLYSALRRADAAGAALMVIVRPPVGGAEAEVWAAVLDRLSRAAKAG